MIGSTKEKRNTSLFNIGFFTAYSYTPPSNALFSQQSPWWGHILYHPSISPLPHPHIHTTGNQHNEVTLCLGTLGNIRTNTFFQHIIVQHFRSWKLQISSLFDSYHKRLSHASLWHMHRFIDLHNSAALLGASQNRQGEWEFAAKQKIAQWANTALVWSCEKSSASGKGQKYGIQKAPT